MSLLGFSFGFGAVDQGMRAAMRAANTGISTVTDGIQDMSDAVKKSAIEPFFDALQSLQLSGIQDTLNQITGEADTLTTSLENEFIQMEKSVRPMLARMGLSGKELDDTFSELSSTAYRLNTDVNTVGDAFYALSETNDTTRDTFKQMGLELEDLVKLEEVTGVKTDELASTVQNMTASFGMTADQSAGLLDTLVSVGQQTGTAETAFGNLKGTLDALSATGLDFTAEEIEQQVVGVQSLTKVMKNLGKTTPEAAEQAMAFNKALIENRQSLVDLGAGQGEFGELFQNLAKETGVGSIADVLDQNDPTKALAMLGEMREQAKAMGDGLLRRFDLALNSMGDGFNYIFEAGDGLTAELKKVQVSTEDTAGALKKMGDEGYRTGLTLDDALSRASDSFDARLNKIGGMSGGYVSSQKKIYKDLGDTIQGLSKDENWGGLTKRFIAAQRIGMSAFYLPMIKTTEQFEQVTDQLSSTFDNKGGLYARLDALRRLGIAGLFVDVSLKGDALTESIDQAQEKVLKMYENTELLKMVLKTIAPSIGTIAGGFAGLAIIGKVIEPMKAAMKLIAGPFRLAFMGLQYVLTGVIGGLASFIGYPALIIGAILGIFGGLALLPTEMQNSIAGALDTGKKYIQDFETYLMSIDFAAIGQKVGATLASIPSSIVAFLSGGGYTSDLSTAMGGVGTALLDGLGTAIRGAKSFIGAMFGELFGSIDLADMLRFYFEEYPTMLLNTMFDIGRFIDGVGPKIEEFAGAISVFLFDLGDNIGAYLDTVFAEDGDGLGGFDVTTVFEALLAAGMNVGKILKVVGKVIGLLAIGIGNLLVQSIAGITKLFGRAVYELFQSAFEIGEAIGALLYNSFSTFYDDYIVPYVVQPIQDGLDNAVAYMVSVWDGINQSVANALNDYIVVPFYQTYAEIVSVINDIIDVVNNGLLGTIFKQAENFGVGFMRLINQGLLVPLENTIISMLDTYNDIAGSAIGKQLGLETFSTDVDLAFSDKDMDDFKNRASAMYQTAQVKKFKVPTVPSSSGQQNAQSQMLAQQQRTNALLQQNVNVNQAVAGNTKRRPSGTVIMQGG